MLERTFRRYVEEASRMPGATGHNLLQLLERRLDSVICRLGFGRTRPMARQVVNHGHILVNDRKVNIPSYRVQVGDVVTLTPRAREIAGVQGRLAAPPAHLPAWLTRADASGCVINLPCREDVEADIREDWIVEFYSR
jgi:small subunit ribosomal protein S4